jgi:hypothetical protein
MILRPLATAVTVALLLGGCTILQDALGDGESSVFTLKAGDCLNDAEQPSDASTVPVVDCDDPHDSEVYAVLQVDGDDFPGVDEVERQADDGCRAAFEDFVGIASGQSRYMFAALVPTRQSWIAGGDRSIVCRIALVDESGTIEKVRGSLAGVAE